MALTEYRYEIKAWQESSNRSNSATIELSVEAPDWATAKAKAIAALHPNWQFYHWEFAVKSVTEIQPKVEVESSPAWTPPPNWPKPPNVRGFRYRGSY